MISLIGSTARIVGGPEASPRLVSSSSRLVPEEVPIAFSYAGSDSTSTLAGSQDLNRQTHAIHAAVFYCPDQGLIAVREDVGRHNALEKLVGAVLLGGWAASLGEVVVTSRLSVEMVQKTAALGVPILIAISAPAALAIRTATAAGIPLIGIALDEVRSFYPARPGG